MTAPNHPMSESEPSERPVSTLGGLASCRSTYWGQACLLAAALALGSGVTLPAMAKGKTQVKSSAAAPAKSSKQAKAKGAKSSAKPTSQSGKAGKKSRAGRAAAVGAAVAAGAAAAAPLGREHWTPEAKSNQAEDAKELATIRAAAQEGDAKAQYLLGSRYRFGKGVKQDLPLAVQWYRKAADQGYAPAQSDLGVLYANGRGVAQDEAQAVHWYRKAADQGDGIAQNNLGLMYAEGRGAPQDDAQAVQWFERSAQSGEASGQYSLGVQKDLGRAYFWLSVAQAKDASLGSRLQAAEQTLNPAERVKVQREARNWKPSKE